MCTNVKYSYTIYYIIQGVSEVWHVLRWRGKQKNKDDVSVGAVTIGKSIGRESEKLYHENIAKCLVSY